jgi:DNA-binding XRE family transcriptional regulator
MQHEPHRHDPEDLAAAFATLQAVARDGVRVTITLEHNPAPPEWEGSTGSWVRSLRFQLRLTQTELAERIGASNHTISLWESGGRTPRHRRTVEALNALAADVNMPPLPRTRPNAVRTVQRRLAAAH